MNRRTLQWVIAWAALAAVIVVAILLARHHQLSFVAELVFITVCANPLPGFGLGFLGYNLNADGGQSSGGPSLPHKPQPTPHKYSVNKSTNCSAANTFNRLKQSDMSAPGAPAAQEGTVAQIPLPGITSPNPISQSVNTPSMTIVNTTLQGHVFDPGQVAIQVTATSNSTSDINITGTGTGNYAAANDVISEILFGGIAFVVSQTCGPTPAP